MHSQIKVNTDARYVELDTDRKIRHRNKLYYRFNHWPIWIFVFFIAPGPLTFQLFERGFDRRICYTTAWGEVVAFALLNSAGLAYAVATGEWRLQQMYDAAYFPIAGSMWTLGAFGLLPRVKPSTKGEGHERRYFYGSVWAVAIAHAALWILWKTMPTSRPADAVKLAVFVGILVVVGAMSRRGFLPRTRPIVPGEWAVSD